jgi:polysaccharide export outer membrane protein
LGAVASNGVKTALGDRVTLLEAIANAGDLTANAAIDRVAVIREMGENRQVFMHDLRSKDIFESPCFYLQQNDIVYVEPKYKKKDTEDKVMQYGTLLLSLTSTISTMMWWLNK